MGRRNWVPPANPGANAVAVAVAVEEAAVAVEEAAVEVVEVVAAAAEVVAEGVVAAVLRAER